MQVLISYDIKKTYNLIHTEVKDAMKLKGYQDIIPLMGGGKCKLPNTTLLKDNITPQQAESDLIFVCRSKSAVLEKYISLYVTIENGRAKSDE